MNAFQIYNVNRRIGINIDQFSTMHLTLILDITYLYTHLLLVNRTSE